MNHIALRIGHEPENLLSGLVSFGHFDSETPWLYSPRLTLISKYAPILSIVYLIFPI